ncbi:MAG: restriction endonuclease subunit S [Rhodoferax sp.]|nr:restriction endonuclease subunit S [Rhodoferax sp.]
MSAGLRAGYKQTEVGVIPEEWEVKHLREFTTIATGNTPPTADAANYGDEFLFVGPVDLGKSKQITHTAKRLSKKGFSISRRFPKDSILFVCIGSTIGKCGIASTQLTSNQQINAIFPSDAFCSDFLYYSVSAAAPRITALAGEQAVPLVNKSQFSEAQISLPPLHEQRAIAAVLSDVDALLAKLDQLIAKKRDLKQAAMQQLLTGQTRLPGFSGEWEVKRLGELLSYEQPTKYLVSSSEYSDANDVPVLTAGKTFILGYTNENKEIFADLPAIIFDDFTTATKYVTFPFKAKSSAMKILKPRNSSVNLRLVYEIMQIIDFTLGDHKRYWISEYSKLDVRIPDAVEQIAIATILSDMDTELAALETRRDKTRALKQGMMQELLTGRIRLV